jgi:hypothetical protein
MLEVRPGRLTARDTRAPTTATDRFVESIVRPTISRERASLTLHARSMNWIATMTPMKVRSRAPRQS